MKFFVKFIIFFLVYSCRDLVDTKSNFSLNNQEGLAQDDNKLNEEEKTKLGFLLAALAKQKKTRNPDLSAFLSLFLNPLKGKILSKVDPIFGGPISDTALINMLGIIKQTLKEKIIREFIISSRNFNPDNRIPSNQDEVSSNPWQQLAGCFHKASDSLLAFIFKDLSLENLELIYAEIIDNFEVFKNKNKKQIIYLFRVLGIETLEKVLREFKIEDLDKIKKALEDPDFKEKKDLQKDMLDAIKSIIIALNQSDLTTKKRGRTSAEKEDESQDDSTSTEHPNKKTDSKVVQTFSSINNKSKGFISEEQMEIYNNLRKLFPKEHSLPLPNNQNPSYLSPQISNIGSLETYYTDSQTYLPPNQNPNLLHPQIPPNENLQEFIHDDSNSLPLPAEIYKSFLPPNQNQGVYNYYTPKNQRLDIVAPTPHRHTNFSNIFPEGN